MTTLDPKDDYVTLINTFHVKPERADELAELLHHASEVMSALPGFVSANLHVSEDKTRVVNYAQWRAKADLEAMYRNPEAQPHMKSAADLAESYDPVLYTLRFSDGASGTAR